MLIIVVLVVKSLDIGFLVEFGEIEVVFDVIVDNKVKKEVELELVLVIIYWEHIIPFKR